MANTSGTTGPEPMQYGGPAGVATALRVLDRHARIIVRHSIAQHALHGNDAAMAVGDLHDRVSRLLHDISLEHGTDAMSTAAEYAAAALDAGTLYPGDELDVFLRQVASAARVTAKELTKSTPFGS